MAPATPPSMDVSAAKDLDETELRGIALKIDRALAREFRRRGVHSSIAGNFKRMFKEIDVDGSNRITLKELDEAVRIRLGLGEELISRGELLSLWKYVDEDRSGELTPDEFQSALYLFKISTWPDYSHVEHQRALSACLATMNGAADKWHKAGGNWFKIFRRMDTDESGSMGFEEIEAVVRTSFPGLNLKPEELGDEAVRGLWKALDVDRSGLISVQEFMIFMRRHAKHHEVLAYGGVPADKLRSSKIRSFDRSLTLSRIGGKPSLLPRTPDPRRRAATAGSRRGSPPGSAASPLRPLTAPAATFAPAATAAAPAPAAALAAPAAALASPGPASPGRSLAARSVDSPYSLAGSWSAPTISVNRFVKPTATEVCSRCVCAATVRCGSCRAFYCQDCCDIVHVGPRAEAKPMRLRAHVIRSIADERCKRCSSEPATMFCWDCDVIACAKCDLILHNQLRLCGHRRCPIINRRRPLDANAKAKCLSKNRIMDVPYRPCIDSL